MEDQNPLTGNEKFLGFVIHNLEKDDFLLYGISNDQVHNLIWTPFPDQAKKFNTKKKAQKEMKKLEINKNKVSISSCYDRGNDIAVLAEQKPSENVNISRKY